MSDQSTKASNYSFGSLKSDAVSGVIVFLVALPLCLGIALASEAPLASGLLTGIVGGLLVGFLSGSHTSVSGPAAGLTAVVAAQIVLLGSFETFLVALFIGGLIQIAMGLLRFGALNTFFPVSVIKGLLTAIGVILILKQLPHLVGWDLDLVGDMAYHQPDDETTFSELQHMFTHFHSGAMLVGFLSLGLLLAWEKIEILKPYRLFAFLVVVFFGVLASFGLSFFEDSWAIAAEHRVQVPVAESSFDFFQFLVFPDFAAFFEPNVYIAGLTIALVASLETLLNLNAVDKLDPEKRVSPANRELVAQGVGNTFLGLIGGIPMTSVIIRSSVNIHSGAKTKFSAIFHGLLLFLCVLFLPSLLNAIPLSCLAAILIVTGFKLASPKILEDMWSQGKNQLIPYVVTVLAIVFTDLLVGVIIGLVVGTVFVLQSNLRRPVRVVQERHPTNTIHRIILGNQLSFLNKNHLIKLFEELPSASHVLLDARDSDFIDGEILNFLKDFKEVKAPLKNIKLSFVGFKESYKLEDLFLYHEHLTPEIQKSLLPKQALDILRQGNERVVRGNPVSRNLNRQITATASGQFPFGAILSCIDSRVPAEMVFDLGIGDIFSVRVAGNIVSRKILGSLEYACAVAGAKIVVVMGHTRCGAISASTELFCQKKITDHKNLNSIVDDLHQVIDKHIDGEIPSAKDPRRETFEEHLVALNVEESIHKIRELSPTLEKLLEEGKIYIVGCIYDVKTGQVNFMEVVGKKDTESETEVSRLETFGEPLTA